VRYRRVVRRAADRARLRRRSELRRPLGIAIVGGLLVSQFLTLYTTPVIYLYLDRLAHRLSRGRRAPPPPVQEQLPGIAAE
jgi:hypothetical protein